MQRDLEKHEKLYKIICVQAEIWTIIANCSVWLCIDSVVVYEPIVTSVNLAVSLVAEIRFVACLM